MKIWIHIVFATKNRQPLLTKEFRYDLFNHIIQNCRDKSIFLQSINGEKDHIHCLISLGKDQAISKVVQLIKGESSFWINQQKFINQSFGWQDAYYAVSVSESQVQTVIKYIQNQEEHHKRKSFEDEVNEFMTHYGWSAIKD